MCIKLSLTFLNLRQLFVEYHMMLKRHWSLVSTLNVHLLLFCSSNPVCKLHIVLEGSRKKNDTDMIWKLHDDLLPNTASLWIINVMCLIKDNPFNILELICIIVNLILEHLSCHDDHCCLSINANISCEDTNIIPKFLFKVSKLLIRESFDRRRVQGFCHMLH